MPLSQEEVQRLRGALQGSFMAPALEQATAVLQDQLGELGLEPLGPTAVVYDRMPDSLGQRWGQPYRDPATGARLMAYVSPTLMATGEFEGRAHLSVWFCLLPADYSGRLMDYLGKGVGCVQLLTVSPDAAFLREGLEVSTWDERARKAFGKPFEQVLAGMAPRCQRAVDQLAAALTP